MNYAGKFDAKHDADGSGLHAHGHAHVETVSAHATHVPADAIIVPDAQLLFNGDFKRSGVDLVLSRDDHELVLHDYFKGEKRAALSSPDGAHLTGELVTALTGHTEYAQAGGAAGANAVIGHVTKLAGSATAIRNGVSIILNQGDNVEKGDVVQSGSDSTVGITFIDGTVFGLSSNARMVLNEMVYDPNGSNNSSLISLVAGTISFVAGQTAKHGDMKIDTPVATMGIRGTAVLCEIDFNVSTPGVPDAKFQVLVEPDGTTGSYILFDKNTLTPIAEVNKAGQLIHIREGLVSISNAGLTDEMQKLINEVFAEKYAYDTTPKTFDHQFTDSIVPLPLTPIILTNGQTITGTAYVLNTSDKTGPSGSSGPINSLSHIDGPPHAVIVNLLGQPISGFQITELAGKTGDSADLDSVSGAVNFVDINAGDTPSVSAKFGSFSYQNAAHQDVTAALNAQQLADIAAVEAKLVLTPNAGNNNVGTTAFSYSVPDSAFDFLAAGETLTLTYNIRVDNNYGPNDESTPLTLTITITGTNDVPVITTGAPSIAFSGGTSVPGGDLPTSDPTSGTLAFTDVDLTDTHTVATALTGAVGVLNGITVLNGVDALPPGPLDLLKTALTASIAAGNDSTLTGNGTINWNLAELPVYIADFLPKGETLTLTYTVTLTDSQGATTTQDVIVTITGTDTPAVVWIATATPGSPPGGLWSDGSNWETGTVPTANDDAIIITNQLIGLTPSYPVTIDAPAFAKTVTLNDFSDLGNAHPELNNDSTLTIGGAFTLGVDSIVDNSGTISAGGAMEVLNASVLNNSGTIDLAQGGDFKDQTSITNVGKIDVTGGTLNILVDVANTGGTLRVESGARAALNSATITGGIVNNSGELDLSGGVVKTGTLNSSGTIMVSGSGNALHGESVTNGGGIEVVGALTVDQGSSIANAGGIVTVDGAATLTLNGATLTSGTATNLAGGTIDLTGNGIVKNGSLGNFSQINVSGAGNALDNETVTANDALEVLAGAALLLDLGTTVANAGGTITVDGTGTLTLGGASITGGTLSIDGTLNSIASSAITDAAIINTGLIESTDGVLTIDPVAGPTLTNSGTLEANGGELDISGDPITNTGTLAAIGDGMLVLSGETVINAVTDPVTHVTTDGTVKIASGSTLELKNAGITGGTLDNSGTFDNEAGSNVVSAAVTNTGTIEVKAGALDLSGGLTGVGTLIIDSGATLELAGADAQTVTFAGGSDTLQLDSTALGFTGTISGVSSSGGTFDITGAASVTSTSGDAIDFTSSGGTSGDPADVTLTPSGGTTGAANGIQVIQNGVGDITVDPTGNVTGLAGDGIIAEVSATGSGNIVVDDAVLATGTGAGSIGVLAENLDAANNGNVTVSQLGGASGDSTGIRALTFGDGDVTVESAGIVTATTQWGIRVGDYGTGDISVTTDSGSTINSGGSGIIVTNVDAAIAASADSMVTVTADGTINSGTAVNPDGGVAGGIVAGYYGTNNVVLGGHGVANTSVNGTVVINNYADITAAAGYGIDAYNYGNGDVTVNDKAGTSVTGAQYGIAAYGLSGGTGDVAVNVDANAKITGTSIDGIHAIDLDTGNVTVSTSGGDMITAGAIGINAVDEATSIPSGDSVSVTANGTINAATGINAGYFPGSNTIAPDVAGDVTVDSNATITASTGNGINAFNWGTGNVKVTETATITAATNGIVASALDGGDATVINDGSVTGTANSGISAGASGGGDVSITNDGTASGATGVSASADGAGNVTVKNDVTLTGTAGSGIDVFQANPGSTGSTTITNDGTVTGAATAAAIAITGNSTGTVEIDNSGTIGPGVVTASTQAISETGGDVTINNYDEINGTINVANGTFTNDGTWQVAGSSGFGFNSSTGIVEAFTINNNDTIDMSGSAALFGANGLDINNTSLIEALSGSTSIDGATIDNSGTIQIDAGVAATLADPAVTNTLTLDNGTAVIDGLLTIGSLGVLDIEAGANGHGATLDDVGVTGTDAVTGIDAAPANQIKVGAAGTATLLLDDGATITNGGLTIGSGSTLDVEAGKNGPGATLDGVTVTGTDAVTGPPAITGSLIEIGATSTATLTLDDGATIANGKLSIGGGSTLHIAAGANAPTGHAMVYYVTGSDPDVGFTVAPNSEINIDASGHVTSATVQFSGKPAQYSLSVTGSSEFQNLSNVPQFSQFVLHSSTHQTANVVISTTTLDLANPQWTENLYGSQDYLFNPILSQQYSDLDLTVFTLGAALNGVDISNSGTIQIDGGTAFTLSGATIDGGTIDDYSTVSGTIIAGDIGVVGSSTIDDNASLNNGIVTIDAHQTLTLDNVTINGVAVIGTDLVLDANGAVVTFASHIDVGVTSAATLLVDDGASITHGKLSIGSGSTLDVEKGTAILATGAPDATLDAVTVMGTDAVTAGGSTLPASLIEVGATSAATLLMDGGTSITSGNISIGSGSTLDIERGAATLETPGVPDVTLNGVSVTGTDAVIASGTIVTPASLIEVGVTSAATLLVDFGTIITNGLMAIGGGSTVDFEPQDATLDGVSVTGTDAVIASGSIVTPASLIEVGVGSSDTLLLVDDGTAITDGSMSIDIGSTLDVEKGAALLAARTPDGTLDGVSVTGTDATFYASGLILTPASLIEVGATSTATLLLDNGTTVTNGTLTVGSGSTLDIEAGANGPGATLDGVGITGVDAVTGDNATPASLIEVGATSTATLLLDDGTTVTNGTLAIGNGGTLDIEAGANGPGATLDGVTVNGSGAIQVDGTVSPTTTLVLDDGTTIINDSLTVGPEGVVEIKTAGGATLDDVHVTNGNSIEIFSGSDLTLDNGTDLTNNGTFTADDGGQLTLNDATIHGGVTDNGTIDVTASSTIDGTLDLGGQIQVEDNAALTLDTALSIGAHTVTLAGANAVLDDAAGLSLAGGTITGSGDLAADTNLTGYGTVSIPLDVADLVTANGGTLEFTSAVDGTMATSFEIAAAANSVLKFDAAVGTASVNPAITFEGDDNGAGVLDLSSISLSNFHGVVAGFDEGETIDVHNAASASIDSTGQILTVFDSSGDSLGTIDFATSYAGDAFNVVNGAIAVDDLVVTVDSATATEGTAIHVTSVTDDGASIGSGATYSWQTQDVNGNWDQVGSNSSYTPTENDEGLALRLVTTYADDPSGSESRTVDLGIVQENPNENADITLAGLTSGNAVEGQQITATVTEPDAPGSGITYTFETSSDGTNWTTVQSGNSATYTPGEADEGNQLRVDVSFTDTHGFAETGTTSAGTVQESPTENADITLAGLDGAGNAVEGRQVVATVTEPDAPSSGITYTWTVGGQTVNPDTDAGNTYTPTAADEGKAIDVSVSFNDTHNFAETGTTSAGTVAAAPAVSFHPAYLSFDGNTVATGPVATTQVGNSADDGVTLAGWVDWSGQSNPGNHAQVLFYNGSTSYAGSGVYGIATANGLDLHVLVGGNQDFDTGIDLSAGQWHDVALTHVNGNFTLYVDGVADFTGQASANGIPNPNDTGPELMQIGGDVGGEDFVGSVANVSVWNAALGQSQIQALQTTSLSGSETNLAAYYPLNDGSGTTAADLINPAGNLSVSGSPTWVANGTDTSEDTALTLNGLSVSFADAGSDTVTTTLEVGHGTLSLGSAAGLISDTGSGTSGSPLILTGTLAAIDAALASGVTYTPTTGYAGTDALSVEAHDGAFQSSTASVAIDVAPVAQAPTLSGPLANVVTDSLTGSTIDSSKWNVVLPTITDTGSNDSSVTPTSSGVVLHDHGYLDTVAGFTPTAATPLHIGLSFTLDSGGGYVAVTDGTDGTIAPLFGAPANGLSFMFDWDGGVEIVNDANGQNTSFDASFSQGTLYDVNITDNGSSQSFVVTNDANSQVVASGTTNFTDYAAGHLVTITNREDNDDMHTATVDNVSISSAYEGTEGGAVTLSGIMASVADPSEVLSLVLSGFPAGTTFSEGALANSGTYAGDWVISDPAEIAALGTTPLTVTPPADYFGTFNLAVEAVATDTATLSTGPVTSTSTATQDFAVTIASSGTPTVTITVDTTAGLDFQHHNALTEMGSGTVQSGGTSTSFTIVDTHDDLQFVVDGSNLTYGTGESGITVAGTITAFHEFTNDFTPVALADFTGLSVDAATFLTDIQNAAKGNSTALDTLTGSFAYNFVGGSGPDTFGSAGQADTLSGTGVDVFDGQGAPAGSHDTLTGGAGSTFVFKAGYGALTITNFDLNSDGNFDASVGDHIELDGFSHPNPSVTDDGNGNATADFGNGDIVTFLHLSAAELNSLGGSEVIGGGNGGNGNGGPVQIGGPAEPVANDVTIVTNADTGTPVSIPVSALLANTSDPDAGDMVFLTGVNGSPFNGSTITASTDFTYQIADRLGDVGSGNVTFANDSGASSISGDGILIMTVPGPVDGGSGNDQLIGSAGDTLSGGAGADTFYYSTGGGAQSIVDFDQGNNPGVFDQSEGDKIDLTGVPGVHDMFELGQIASSANDDGSFNPNGPDTLLNFGNGDTLLLRGISLGNLSDSDFVFSNEVNWSVTSSTGYDGSKLYSELGNSVMSSVHDAAHFELTDSTDGLTFEMVGGGLSYSGTTVTGGSVTEIDILDSSNNTLVHSTGWNISATALMGAIGDNSVLDAIFKTVAYEGSGNSGNDVLVGGNIGNELIGNGGTDTLDGGAGKDLLIASAGGNTTMVGGGGSDLFQYNTATGSSTVATIVDFDQGNGGFNQGEGDTINIASVTSVHNLTGLLTDATTVNDSDTLINFGSGNTLQIDGVSPGQLTGADFQFSPSQPVLDSFTLNVSEGGTTVLTNSDFSVTDFGFTNFTYSVNNVTHGEFEVFNGQNWMSAPTGGFTTAQIGYGDVRFVQNGDDAAPTFTIQVSDGSNVSPAISPTVNFSDTAPYVVTSTADTTDAGTLRSAIVYANAHPGTIITFSGAIANQTITLSSELPLILGDGTTIDGGAHNITVSGNNEFRVFFVGGAGQLSGYPATTATIENLTIGDAKAQGGEGGDSTGGGGAGLGGAIFVSSTGSLSLSGIVLSSNEAVGGDGGSSGEGGGGGGGMGGTGGTGNGGPAVNGGGGGGFGNDATGGPGTLGPGASGAFTDGISGGSDGGGGAGGSGGSGGGVGGSSGSGAGVGFGNGGSGGAGGFGGGGGGGADFGAAGGSGGFGGGGGGGAAGEGNGGAGGFGGGGGGGGEFGHQGGAAGGFGGGAGIDAGGGGGGGAGMGGAVFVQSGGALTINGTLTVDGNTATGGAGGGSAFGSGIFYQGTDGATSTLSFGAGNQIVSDVIADYIGSGGTNPSGGTDAADQGGSLALVKTGGGTLTLTGADTYTGATTVVLGTLEVDGSISQSAVTVETGATLDGSGTTGAVAVQSGGLVMAGTGGGILSTGSLSLAAGSTLDVEIGGSTPVPGGYGQLDVAGTVALNGATLSTSLLNSFAPATGTFEIINNEGSAPVSGTFAGLAEGATFAAGGEVYKISYAGGDGNDVTLTVVPPPAVGTDNIALAAQSFFGTASESQGAAVTYADGHLYLSYNNGPAGYGTSDTSDIVAFNTGPAGASQTFTDAWSKGDFFGIAADGGQIYAAGESYPGYGLTYDVGGIETKSIFVRFDADGTAGSGPSSAEGYTPNNFFSYLGFESFSNVIATQQAGQTFLYAVGTGQPESYDAYFIAKYDSSGDLLAQATDSSVNVQFSDANGEPVPGSSAGNDVVYFNGDVWALGDTAWPNDNGGAMNSQAVVWEYDTNLNLLGRFKDTDATLSGQSAAFYSGTVLGNSLYAVGHTSTSSGGQNYLIADYNSDGSIAWSKSFGDGGTDTLNGTVTINGHLYVIGSFSDGASTDGVLMEIDPSNGNVISSVIYDPAQYNSFTSVTTDGQHLYVAGVSGNSVSQDQAVLLTYDVGAATTTVEDTTVVMHSLAVSDVAAGSAQIEVTLSAGHGSVALEDSSGLDSVVQAGTAIELFGSQTAINAALAQGVVYDPTANYTGSDTLAITASDQGDNGSGVALSSTQNVGITVTPADSIADHATFTVSGPSGDTVAFATGNGTLDLAQPSTFTGEIAGISGTGDVLDLHGFAVGTTAVTGSGSFNSATGITTLTVTDPSDNQTETFKLVGNLSTSTWTVTDDGHGGANIVDPPASGSSVGGVVMHDPGPTANQVIATAPNQTLTGAGTSNFVFNFPTVGQDIVTNFHPSTDTLQFSSPIFATAQTALNATQDDGHGNTVITVDAHDAIVLSGVLKAQLQAADFHFV